MGAIQPLVSIISPTYNHEKYISQCIESVLAQTYSNWEMIVIDDGSEDRTAEIVQEYAVTDSRIKFSRQENIGIFRLAETYNRALELSGGELIAILEGDDLWNEDKLAVQVEAMMKSPAAVLSWSQVINKSADLTKVYGIFPDLTAEQSKYFTNDPPGSIVNIFLFRNCIPAVTILMRREALQRIGGFRQNYELPLVDLPTLYELALLSEFIFTQLPLATWRIYPEQVTKTHTVRMLDGFYSLAEEYFHKPEIRKRLEPTISFDKIKRYYRGQFVISRSRSGRYKLIRKEFKAARNDYRDALSKYYFTEPVWKLRALTGLIFSYFHWDVERLAKWFGKGSIRK